MDFLYPLFKDMGPNMQIYRVNTKIVIHSPHVRFCVISQLARCSALSEWKRLFQRCEGVQHEACGKLEIDPSTSWITHLMAR